MWRPDELRCWIGECLSWCGLTDTDALAVSSDVVTATLSGTVMSNAVWMLPYEELTPPGRKLWDAFPEGRQVDLRAGTPSGDDPAGGSDWGPNARFGRPS